MNGFRLLRYGLLRFAWESWSVGISHFSALLQEILVLFASVSPASSFMFLLLFFSGRIDLDDFLEVFANLPSRARVGFGEAATAALLSSTRRKKMERKRRK